MAKLIKKPSALQDEYLALKSKFSKILIVLLIFIVLAIVGNLVMLNTPLNTTGLVVTCLSVLGFLVSLIMITTTQNEIVIKRQGIEGEERVSSILSSSLDDSYTIIQNVVVTLDGKSSELDLVVVGNNGIFIVEVKNRNGRIQGSFDNSRWYQHKVGSGGGVYSSSFYSPVKQVSTHIFRLAGFLRQNGVRFHILGSVFFSNPEALLRIEGEPGNIPVFGSYEDLIHYIRIYNGSLPYEIKEKVIGLLK